MAREATRGIERCRIGGGQEDKGWRKGRVRTRLLIPEIGVFVSCSSRAWLLVGTRENLTRKQKHFLPLWVGLCHSWHRGSALLTPLYVVGYPPMYSPAPMYSRPCPACYASALVKPSQTLPPSSSSSSSSHDCAEKTSATPTPLPSCHSDALADKRSLISSSRTISDA